MARGNRRRALDLTLARIEAYNEAHGGGVMVRKVANGYTLIRESTREPLARLRPIGSDDRWDVLWWSHRDRWESIGDFGGIQLPLEEALDYIADDPMGCFWR
jgi:hypothetical protein